MKKHLTALAVAGLLAAPAALAQTPNINISGYVSMGVAQYSYSGAPAGVPAASETRVDDGRYSRFRLSGTQDVGHGLKADVMIEQRFLADDAGLSGVANGNTWVGLAGDFGKVYLGRIDAYYGDGILTELNRAGPFHNHLTLSLLNQDGSGAYPLSQSRYNNQIRYDTPTFGGVRGSVAYARTEGNTFTGGGSANRNGLLYASAFYLQGPIYAGASYTKQDTGVNTNNTGLRAYGSYTFPFGLKVGANIDRLKTGVAGASDVSRTAWMIPISFRTGSHAFYGNYGQAGNRTNVNDSGVKALALGYDFAINPRTSVGAYYTMIDNKTNGAYRPFFGGLVPALGGNATAGVAGVKTTALYAGIVHAF